MKWLFKGFYGLFKLPFFFFVLGGGGGGGGRLGREV